MLAGILTDLVAFDESSRTWTDLTAPIGPLLPFSRYQHGFASSGSELYVLGGRPADLNGVNLCVCAHVHHGASVSVCVCVCVCVRARSDSSEPVLTKVLHAGVMGFP